MAIAYGTSGTATHAPLTAGTSKSVAINVGSGTDRMLWVGSMGGDNSTDITTNLTYGGVAMTKLVGRRLNTSTQYMTLWYLANPASGSNTLAWTGSANEAYVYAVFTVFTGVPAGTFAVGSNTASADETDGSLALTLTTQYDNAWLVSICRSTDYGDHTAGTGTTERQQLAMSIGDSNGGITPVGSATMNWNNVPANGKTGGVMGHFIDVATASITVSAGVNAGTFSVPTYTAKTAVTLVQSVLTALFSIPTYIAYSGSVLLSPSTQSATFSAIASTVTGASRVAGNTLSATFSAITYAIGLGSRIMQATLSATFTTAVLTKVGSIWTKTARNASGIWTRITRNND